MTTTPAPLVEYKFIESVETTQFTASGVTILDAVSVTNTGAGVVELSLSIVPNGGSAGDSNRAITERILRADEAYLCPEVLGHVLAVGDSISAMANAATSLNIRVTGRVIS